MSAVGFVAILAGCSQGRHSNAIPPDVQSGATAQSSGQAPPTFVRAAAETTAGSARVRRLSSQFTQGGDQSDDVCEYGYTWCIIQGQKLNVATWGLGETRPGTVTWTVGPLPSGVTGDFTPKSVTGPPYQTTLPLTAAPGAVVDINPIHVTFTFAASDGKPGYSGSYVPDLNLRVACSDNNAKCPRASIFDNRQGSTPVDVAGSPPPTEHVVIGNEMDLRVDWKKGTGSTTKGTYAADPTNTSFPISWQIPGTADKSYDFTTGNAPTPLGTADTSAADINYYWMSGSTQSGDSVTVDVPLKRSDGKELAYVRGQALYVVAAPTVSNFGPKSYQTNPVLTPSTNPDTLSQGNPTIGYGMTYIFTVQAPSGGAGHIAGVQTVQRQITYVPDSAGYDHGTPGNSTQLDTCALYSAASSIGAGATQSWPLSQPLGDRPAVVIGRASVSPLTDVRIQDYFNTYLMYRPTITAKRKAIWVPLGNMQWQWASRAYRNTAALPWNIGDVPGGNASFTYVTFAGSSAQVPLFSGTYAPQQQACPPIPST